MVKKLEEICAAKVVAKLCCKPKIKEQFLTINVLPAFPLKKHFEDFIKLNKILEQQFLDEIKSLPYPIRRFMPKHLIHFMAIEILEWKEYYYRWDGLSPSYCLSILKSSHFTHKGTLDKVLIARDMIQDKSLDVRLRISIAIDYFLIEDIRALWGEMSEREKKLIRKRKFNKNFWERNQFKKILYFATENSLNDECLLPVCLDAFRFNKEVALKNCWKRLSLSEKERVSKESSGFLLSHFSLSSNMIYDNEYFLRAPSPECLRFLIYDANKNLKCLIFLIYNANEELLKKLLKEPLRGMHLLVLKYLLFWPYQDIFIKTLKLVWEKITHIHFFELLHSIIDMIEDDEISNTYNYRLILKEVWCLASPDYRKSVISTESDKYGLSYATTLQFFTFEWEGVKFSHCYAGKRNSLLNFLLSRLFCLKTFTNADVKFVELFASNLTESERQEIVSTQGDDICEEALISGKLDLADLFIECFVEKELISEYKQGLFTRRSKYITEFLLSSGKRSLLDDIANWASDFKTLTKSLEDLNFEIK